MSFATSMNLAALAVAIAALAVSVFFARRQLSSTTATSTVQVAIEILTRETRSDAFMESEDFVLNHLPQMHPPSQGVSKLPLEARKHFKRIAFYYADLGILSLFGDSQATLIVASMHGPALRTWSTLEPYIQAERVARNSTKYLSFFEHLACVCTDIDLVDMHEKLGLRTFGTATGRAGTPAGRTAPSKPQPQANPPAGGPTP
jgi:hypothetical protein